MSQIRHGLLTLLVPVVRRRTIPRGPCRRVCAVGPQWVVLGVFLPANQCKNANKKKQVSTVPALRPKALLPFHSNSRRWWNLLVGMVREYRPWLHYPGCLAMAILVYTDPLMVRSGWLDCQHLVGSFLAITGAIIQWFWRSMRCKDPRTPHWTQMIREFTRASGLRLDSLGCHFCVIVKCTLWILLATIYCS